MKVKTAPGKYSTTDGPSSFRHEGPPGCVSRNIRVDHFKGVGHFRLTGIIPADPDIETPSLLAASTSHVAGLQAALAAVAGMPPVDPVEWMALASAPLIQESIGRFPDARFDQRFRVN